MTEHLRSALQELGDRPAPADLADRALDRARRDRRRGVVAAGATVVAVAAAVAVPVAVLDRPSPPPVAAAPARLIVAGYASRDPAEPTSGLGRYVLYDRAAAGYAPSRWRAAVPSPDLVRVAVIDETGRVGVAAADRADDPRAVRWLPGTAPAREAVWSPDGRRLLVPTTLRSDRSGPSPYELQVNALVVEVRTLATRSVAVLVKQPGIAVGRVVFGPGGVGVAVAPGYNSTDVLQIWAEHGRVVALSIGPATLPDQPFSPGGRLVLVTAAGEARVLDLASGAEVGSAAGAAVGWYDDERYLVRAGGTLKVVEVASGRVLAEKELAPAGRELTGVWLAPLAGPAPPGAIVL